MNGASSLVRTLLASGVDTCFANPGTSEMHFVAALDQIPGMRPDQKDATILAAIPALVRIAPEEAKTLLAPLAKSDPSMQVRSAATEALAAR